MKDEKSHFESETATAVLEMFVMIRSFARAALTIGI
jgi:hypothetical protein